MFSAHFAIPCAIDLLHTLVLSSIQSDPDFSSILHPLCPFIHPRSGRGGRGGRPSGRFYGGDGVDNGLHNGRQPPPQITSTTATTTSDCSAADRSHSGDNGVVSSSMYCVCGIVVLLLAAYVFLIVSP